MQLGILILDGFISRSAKTYNRDTLVIVTKYGLRPVGLPNELIAFNERPISQKHWDHVVVFLPTTRLLSLLFPKVLNKNTE